MCSEILTEKGGLRHTSSYCPLTPEELKSPIVLARLNKLDELAVQKFGEPLGVNEGFDPDPTLGDGDEGPTVYDGLPMYEQQVDPTSGKSLKAPDADDTDYDAYDRFLHAELELPYGDNKALAKVIGRKRDKDGNIIGKSDPNPLLDTSVYQVQFLDGAIEEIDANTIATNILSQVDDDGNCVGVIAEIIDHRKGSEAVSEANDSVDHNGKTYRLKTTRGWWLCVQWTDGSSTWERLADMKEAAPLEVANYAVAKGIDKEPAFKWWVHRFIKRSKRVVSKLKQRLACQSYKFGIKVPTTVEEALELDKQNGNTYWIDAIRKEMKNNRKAFKILDEDAPDPVGHKFIKCHMVFDVKMDWTRKARFCAGGHMTDPPASITYASVVSRDSVRIALTLAALNDLNVMTADLQNAYLNADCGEKIWTICGPEFGPELQGRKAIIVKAPYGLKTSAYQWRNCLCEVLREFGWVPSRADPDVWMKPAVKASGDKIYEYLLIYVDDLLVIAIDPKAALDEIGSRFTIKPDSMGEPTQYLGAQVSMYTFEDDPEKVYWAMSSEKYVKEAIRNVQDWVNSNGYELKKSIKTHFPTGYRPKLDTTEELGDEEAQFYMSQVSVLRWAVELGRIDIAVETSLLSSHMAAPRKGHLLAMLHVFAYLMHYPRSKMVFDSARKNIKMRSCDPSAWKDFYYDAKEPIPADMPEPRGKAAQLIAFVDSDHAGDLLIRRSRTGYLIFLNSAPIVWLSKRQLSVETSSFGSEFVALKQCTYVWCSFGWTSSHSL